MFVGHKWALYIAIIMPINGGAATAVATVAAAEVSMASLLMAAGAVDLPVVIDDDISLWQIDRIYYPVCIWVWW